MDLFTEKNIKPMLLSEEEKPFDSDDYFFEIKFDGIRALIYVSPDEIIIKNKRGKILNDTFPELLKIKDIVKHKCIFDGEIVLMQNGLPSFSKLQERVLLKDKIKINYFSKNFPVTFVCFDILYEDNNLIDYPLNNRRKILDKYPDTDEFIKSRVVNGKGTKLYKIVKKQGIEGIVAKLKSSEYTIGKRSKNWIKIKSWKEEDFYIAAYKEEEHVASLVLCNNINDTLKFVSKVVVAKKTNDFKIIKKCSQIKNQIIDFNDNDYIFIKPIIKCTVMYLEKTKNNHLRQPIFKGIRLD